jgi:hypothetical protein
MNKTISDHVKYNKNNEMYFVKNAYVRHKKLLTRRVSEKVKLINDFTMNYFAKKSITKYGFFTSLRKIEKETIYIKLYYYPETIRNSNSEIQDFASEFYRSEINDMSYKHCNIIRIPLKIRVNSVEINSCQSMSEMELIFLNTLTNDSWIGTVPRNRGKGTCTISGVYTSLYPRWKKLLEEGYLEPEYEEKCKADLLLTKVEKSMENKNSTKKYSNNSMKKYGLRYSEAMKMLEFINRPISPTNKKENSETPKETKESQLKKENTIEITFLKRLKKPKTK